MVPGSVLQTPFGWPLDVLPPDGGVVVPPDGGVVVVEEPMLPPPPHPASASAITAMKPVIRNFPFILISFKASNTNAGYELMRSQ